MLVSAFSGGKDSTCMVLRQAELGESGELLFNVVGNEFPDLLSHVKRIAGITGWKLTPTVPAHGGLHDRILEQATIPNARMRWCTRELKIEPTQAYLLAHPGSTLCVGLRADEEAREGIYGDVASYRYPLREWGWGLKDVNAYLEEKRICVPRRTNCPLCYGQRLSEWWILWKEHPELFAEGEAIEATTGHTFRSPSRDTWPASLHDLKSRFEAGDTPRDVISLPLFGEYDTKGSGVCRVCEL